jgi:hypothetical protein
MTPFMRSPHCFFVAAAAALALLSACRAPAPAPLAMSMDAYLVVPDVAGSAPDQVMTTVTLRDSAGAVVAAPRVFAYVGSPATVQMGDSETSFKVVINSARNPEGVLVTATLTQGDAGAPSTATSLAKTSLPPAPTLRKPTES